MDVVDDGVAVVVDPVSRDLAGIRPGVTAEIGMTEIDAGVDDGDGDGGRLRSTPGCDGRGAARPGLPASAWRCSMAFPVLLHGPSTTGAPRGAPSSNRFEVSSPLCSPFETWQLLCGRAGWNRSPSLSEELDRFCLHQRRSCPSSHAQSESESESDSRAASQTGAYSCVSSGTRDGLRSKEGAFPTGTAPR